MTNAAGFFSTAVSEMRRCDRSAARKQPATSGPRPAPTTKIVLHAQPRQCRAYNDSKWLRRT